MSTTSAEHHVQAIIDLLDAADASEWTPDPPDVRRYWDDAQSEKGPGGGQPAVAYVWSPADSTLDRFSIDGTKFRQTNTVEVQLWSLDEQEPVQLQNDVVEILSGYLDDNKTETPYSDVAPTSVSDFREQKPARITDHYIMSVVIDTDGLSDTGLANGL